MLPLPNAQGQFEQRMLEVHVLGILALTRYLAESWIPDAAPLLEMTTSYIQ
jgi:hypothetical protein